MFENILENVKSNVPLVHLITNYVTVNDCANIVLACGGSPIMADEISEVCDITSICKATVINMGTLNERTIKSMILAGKKANELSHPVIFDPVGAGASRLRNETALTLLKEVKFSVIRGNVSEIKFLASGISSTKGVDVSDEDVITNDNIDSTINMAKSLAKTTGSIIAISGATDIVTDGNKTYIIKNGHSMMSMVSGTGCMLSAILGAFASANYDNILDATACAFSAFGLSGEKVYKRLCEIDGGTSTYKTLLIDFMSKMNYDILKDGMKVEVR